MNSKSNGIISKVGLPVMVGCGGLIVLAIAALILIVMYMNIVNTEVQLRAQFEAKQDEATLAYDDMWKIISEQAGVASSYRDSFGDIYNEMISARYEHGGGQMMQWIQESNPEFDTSLMSDLMASIEAQRVTSRRVQTELLDIERQHTTFVQSVPNNFFVGGRCCLDAQIVTSTRTENSFATGRDDETLDFNNLGRPQAEDGRSE